MKEQIIKEITEKVLVKLGKHEVELGLAEDLDKTNNNGTKNTK